MREQDAAGITQGGVPALPDRALAERLVRDAVARWAESRRARIDAFVASHYSLKGALAIHREALGWDLVRAPANLTLGTVQAGANIASWAARKSGADALADRLVRRPVFLPTDVARRIERLVMVDFLELPYADDDGSSERDSLAEAILAEPGLAAALDAAAAPLVAGLASGPEASARLAQAVAGYAGTRAAAADIATALACLATGLAAFRQATPGVLSLTPVVAGAIARRAALGQLPAGAALAAGIPGVHAGLAGPLLTMGVGTGLVAVAAIAGALGGIVTDPLQARLGLHRKRLVRLVDAIETQMTGADGAPFVARDHYVARLLDVVDVLRAAQRLMPR